MILTNNQLLLVNIYDQSIIIHHNNTNIEYDVTISFFFFHKYLSILSCEKRELNCYKYV